MPDQGSPRYQPRSSSLAFPQSSPYDSPTTPRTPQSRSSAGGSSHSHTQSPGLMQSPSRRRPPPALELDREREQHIAGPSFVGPSFGRSPSMPLTNLASLQLPPGASQPAAVHPSSSTGPRMSISNSSDGRVSLDSYYLAASPSYYQTNHTAGPLPIPQTPDPPDPYSLDRGGLIGVGELATPRWTAMSGYRHMRTPSQPMPARAGVGLVIREEPAPPAMSSSSSSASVATHLSPRTSPLVIARSFPGPANKIDPPSIGSLGSFGEGDFVAGMQDALASVSEPEAESESEVKPTLASIATNGPTPPPPRVPSKSPRHTHRTPPPPEENVVYVPPTRTRSKHSPPNSADSSKRKSDIKTPGSPHHDILKHFAAKDFSHLPPSPSSASINQFLRGSGSINNFAAVSAGTGGNGPTSAGSPSSAPQGGATNAYPFPSRPTPAPTLRGASSGSHLRQEIDPETAEALRKLDGLGARSKSKEKVASRPVTPPPPPPATSHPTSAEKRTSSSTATASSLSTNPTTPSSAGPPKRRGSDTSSIVSDLAASIGELEKEGARIVPPVPPLPKDFQALRASLAQPLPTGAGSSSGPGTQTDVPPLTDTAGSSPVSTTSKRPMNKKWSFSSALNLNFNSHSTPVTSPEAPLSPQAWTHVDLPPTQEPSKERPAPARTDTGSSTSTSATLAPAKPSPGVSANAKRMTPSSIPFFRRSSSSLTGSKLSAPATSAPPIAPGEITPVTARKSVFGGIPSMLKGSGSKRNLSAQLEATPVETPLKSAPLEDPRKSSMGWTGRRRGKTLSTAAADAPGKTASMPPPSGPPPSQASSRLRASLSVAPADGSAPRSGLPSITASPTKPPSSSTVRPAESYRGLSATTPTKIPRIASRTVAASPSVQGNMLPPAVPAYATARSATIGAGSHRSTMNQNEAVINEFGVVSGANGVSSQTTTRIRPVQTPPRDDHQYHPDPSGTVTPRRGSGQNLAPPSRRALPQPPSSATATTASAAAKKTSREVPASRRSSAAPLAGNGETSPVKPSRSVHAKLSVPSTGRISSSTSSPIIGTPSSARQSFVSRSPSSSPFEDEESLGDSEMAAYVKRRKARKPSSSKPDDLSDLLDFPEPIPPAEATSPRSFIQKQFATLSDYERKEILDFSEIYYWGAKSEKNAARTDVTLNNYGYDDERGDYLIVPHDHLAYRYEVIGILGKGSFGQVIQCRDHKTGESVAVKIIRNKKRFHHQALVEVKILKQLVDWDPEDKHYLIRMTENFYFRGHLCIVTELLSINLYELIKANSFVGFTTVLIRRFTTQMLASLQLMRSHRIVHCDLKPENILLRHPAKSGIKVIDFGSSCLESEKVYTYIQSRFYRSPEVILGMNYHMAIDMWSLGCILAELYTGFPIFPGENENEQLACIMEVMGVPDRYLLDRATRKKQFFDATGAPRPFVNAKGKRRRPGTKTLAQVLKCDDELFVDFIAKCLLWDPERRLKPQAALRHPWISAGRRRMPVASSPASTPRKMMLISGPTALGARAVPPHSASRLARNTYQPPSTTA